MTAQNDPERVAIECLQFIDLDAGVFDVKRVTYAELNMHSNRLARYFQSNGLAKDVLVAIFLEKSISFYVSILATIKIGAGYVPITPQTPARRVNSILAEANCHICITNSLLSQVLEPLNTTKIIELDGHEVGDVSSANITASDTGSSVAYAVFTSGSTGKPKGVLITHHNLQSNIFVLSKVYPTSQGSKLLQACSLAFDG
jgi:non-ribosomal peptide synthetase component F